MRTKVAAAVILVLALLTACTKGEKEGPAAAAPDFTLKDLDGRAVKLSGLKGSVVLVEFWATWCPPCRTSMPALQKLHETYGGKGLTVLAVSMDEGGVDKVRAFSRERNLTYTVLMGNDEVAGKYGVRMIPATFLVDRQGSVQKRYVGEMSEERIEKDIQALL